MEERRGERGAGKDNEIINRLLSISAISSLQILKACLGEGDC